MKRSLQLNPDNRPASAEQIKDWRDKHESSPVEVALGSFDCDPLSELRMSDSIAQFDMLPTLNPDDTLNWILGDNSVLPMTKAELISTLAEVETTRAVRSATLHVKALLFKQQPIRPTPAQLANLSFWM